jgi:hypothetical protein
MHVLAIKTHSMKILNMYLVKILNMNFSKMLKICCETSNVSDFAKHVFAINFIDRSDIRKCDPTITFIYITVDIDSQKCTSIKAATVILVILTIFACKYWITSCVVIRQYVSKRNLVHLNALFIISPKVCSLCFTKAYKTK